jgi:hypothetical protein
MILRHGIILGLVATLAYGTPAELRPLLYLLALVVGLFTERVPEWVA